MASSTLTPYCNNVATQTFILVSTTAIGARYMASGRAISCPYTIEIVRKLNPNGTGNDHVGLRIARTEQNVTTGKLATCQFLLDISIPKDQSIITQVVQKELGAILASIFNESTAMEATSVALTALVEGRDL